MQRKRIMEAITGMIATNSINTRCKSSENSSGELIGIQTSLSCSTHSFE